MELDRGWTVAAAPPGCVATAEDLGDAGLEWLSVRVPGTVATAVADDGRDLDAEDWWFRCRFTLDGVDGDGDLTLELDGLATVCEVFLNGRPLIRSTSMWEPHSVSIEGRAVADGDNELVIVCRALAPLLSARRRPRARWRSRTVNDNNLRWYRTMIFGRSPGFAPHPAAVGPWRPVRVLRRRSELPRDFTITTRVDGDIGAVRAYAPARDGAAAGWYLSIGDQRVRAQPAPDGGTLAQLKVSGVERWWPHTHGAPRLYEAAIDLDGEPVATRRVGFRDLQVPADIAAEGFAVTLNGVSIHLRGAVWTPLDLIGLAPDRMDLRQVLLRVRDCGMNLLRVVGTAHYESTDFHDLCDELGILIWQDLMFANLDYPLEDEAFRGVVEAEARRVVRDLAHRPSLVCVCGNSEVEQQPAMMGLDPTLGRHPFWEETLPAIVRSTGSDAGCVRSTPSGGLLPFQPGGGVTHYFGVSGYMLDLADVRRSEVRFATECLAFANVPDDVEFPVHDPRWKAGVQRDAGTGWNVGAGWDFDDVRDHYLATWFGVDPVPLRRYDHARYLELSRAVSGEVMAATMNEWRRAQSPCRGALVLWLSDMAPGAGLGILDVSGAPKVCYHHLRRALAPVAVWMTDEKLAGVAIHVANDRPEPLRTTLRLALYREDVEVDRTTETLALDGHAATGRSVEGMLGRFLDAAWAYRFGPPAADVIVATLEGEDEARPLSQAFFFTDRRSPQPRTADELGLHAGVQRQQDGVVRVTLRARALIDGARVHAAGFTPSDDAFCVEPGRPRAIDLVPSQNDAVFGAATVRALNLTTPLTVTPPR